MVKRTFTLEQIEKRVDDLSTYLDDRELRLDQREIDFDTLNQLHDKVETLGREIGRLRTSFNHAVGDVIKQRQDQILADVIKRGNMEEIAAVTKRFQKDTPPNPVENEDHAY